MPFPNRRMRKNEMVESKRRQYIRALKIAANHADDGMITVSVDEAEKKEIQRVMICGIPFGVITR